MNLLLDTHVLLWWFEDNRRLGSRTREILLQPNSTISVSAASVWEISIKTATGRLKISRSLQIAMDELSETVHEIPIEFSHALAAGRLPAHHSDPFDRMLVAQAQCEDLTLVTVDPMVMQYDVRTIDASL